MNRPTALPDLSTRNVDGSPVEFVRPLRPFQPEGQDRDQPEHQHHTEGWPPPQHPAGHDVTGHPAFLPDLFTREVDQRTVQFVRPADTEEPSWYAYEDDQPLGALRADTQHGTTAWVLQQTQDRHHDLDDAVRALRQRPTRP